MLLQLWQCAMQIYGKMRSKEQQVGPLGRGLLLCAGGEKRREGAEGRKESLSHKMKGAVQELAEDVATLCKHPVYLSTVAGQTLYTGQLPCPQPPQSGPSSLARYVLQER